MNELTPELILKAYAAGIFPMADDRDDPDLHWVEPKVRGILPFETFHIPRRLAKTVRQDPFEITIDSDFPAIIRACADSSPNRDGTWINDTIMSLYTELHRRGHVHSVECWRDQKLVGGLYGVSLGSVFFGESMFSRETNASKVALVHLVARLLAGGYTLLDAQFTTGHLKRFGAVGIPRDDYQSRLHDALSGRGDFGALSETTKGTEALDMISDFQLKTRQS